MFTVQVRVAFRVALRKNKANQIDAENPGIAHRFFDTQSPSNSFHDGNLHPLLLLELLQPPFRSSFGKPTKRSEFDFRLDVSS